MVLSGRFLEPTAASSLRKEEIKNPTESNWTKSLRGVTADNKVKKDRRDDKQDQELAVLKVCLSVEPVRVS
jgi:hypothetical protein